MGIALSIQGVLFHSVAFRKPIAVGNSKIQSGFIAVTVGQLSDCLSGCLFLAFVAFE
jgi:hypothetical protein